MTLSAEEDFQFSQVSDEPHFVFLQHGSHGQITDMGFLVGVLERCASYVPLTPSEISTERKCPPRVVFQTPVNEGITTDWGINYCCERAAKDLFEALLWFVSSHEGSVRFSVVGTRTAVSYSES